MSKDDQMNEEEIIRRIDQQRWLINNGLISDSLKNQLFFCGSIVHKEVQAIEMAFVPEQKRVDYVIYLPLKVLNQVEKYEKLSKSTSLIGLWRFKRMLKKNGVLDFSTLLNQFVKDFCGPKWTATVVLKNYSEYQPEAISEESRQGWALNTATDPG